MLNPTLIEILGTACFGSAILHTFLVKRFQHWAKKFKEGTVAENLLHLLGEIEVVFGLWGALFLFLFGLLKGFESPVHYLESRNFTEPLFVFVIMVVCGTKPILEAAALLIHRFSKLIPTNANIAYFLSLMIVGPLLGSLITEPAAMTVTALLLARAFFSRKISTAFKYASLGLLFVSISIGGTLTPFAAPPVLMVAKSWDWDLNFMLTHFGWKSALAILMSTFIVVWRFKKELKQLKPISSQNSKKTTPAWVILIHLLFLFMIVLNAHHPVVFIGIFLFFLGLVAVTQEFHDELMLRSGLLVAFFLGGLVVFGELQRWWLEPVLTQLNAATLFGGATILTAFTDNAALTYMGAQVPHLSEISKYALVAGAVTGGGLTVIANAPNPAGFGILNRYFGKEGISPIQLFLNALLPTLIAVVFLWGFHAVN